MKSVKLRYIHHIFEKLRTLSYRRAAIPPSHHHYTGDKWPFQQPQNWAAITMRQVLDGSEPILIVSHDADDHSWHFIGSSNPCRENRRMVCLEAMVAHDPSILQLADLPLGWWATRRSPKHPWACRQCVPDDEFDEK